MLVEVFHLLGHLINHVKIGLLVIVTGKAEESEGAIVEDLVLVLKAKIELMWNFIEKDGFHLPSYTSREL